MLKRLLKCCGAAMLWAVAALLITAIIAVGIVATAAAYYRSAVSDLSQDKAQLLAQSGMNYAIHRITETDATGDYSWLPRADALELGILTLDERTVYFDGERRSENCAVIDFRAEKPSDSEDYCLIVTSTAEWGGKTAQITGVFIDGGGGAWQYAGCVQ